MTSRFVLSFLGHSALSRKRPTCYSPYLPPRGTAPDGADREETAQAAEQESVREEDGREER